MRAPCLEQHFNATNRGVTAENSKLLIKKHFQRWKIKIKIEVKMEQIFVLQFN